MYRPPHLRQQPPNPDPLGMTFGLSERISMISSANVVPNPDFVFKNPRLVGSYNWIDDKHNKPIIAVPGLPDVWEDSTDGNIGQLRSDDEIPGYIEFPDHHGARLLPYGLSRFEPIFHALKSPSELFGVQLVADRNSLRKIYGLYTPDRMYGPKPFRIDAQKIGNVVLLARWENSVNREPIQPRGFCWSQSHSIATMRQKLEGAGSSHGIVRYGFGGIEMVIRFELDAVTESSPKINEGGGDVERTGLHLKPLGLDSSRNDPLPLPKSTETKSGIRIYRTPYPTPPLSSYLEKKTRTINGELDYIDIYGQLVFSQTPHLYVARHTRGQFKTLEKVSLGQGKLRDIARSTEGIMAKSAGMIREMMDVVEEFGECSFVWKGEGSGVEVWKGEKQVGLSEEARVMLLAA